MVDALSIQVFENGNILSFNRMFIPNNHAILLSRPHLYIHVPFFFDPYEVVEVTLQFYFLLNSLLFYEIPSLLSGMA